MHYKGKDCHLAKAWLCEEVAVREPPCTSNSVRGGGVLPLPHCLYLPQPATHCLLIEPQTFPPAPYSGERSNYSATPPLLRI